MSEDLGMDVAVDAPANFDIRAYKTPSGKSGRVYCGRLHAQVADQPKQHVGGAMEFPDISEWAVEGGDAVITYDDKYFEGPGEAKISLCVADEIVSSCRLKITEPQPEEKR
jgi:hypothetical protein